MDTCITTNASTCFIVCVLGPILHFFGKGLQIAGVYQQNNPLPKPKMYIETSRHWKKRKKVLFPYYNILL